MGKREETEELILSTAVKMIATKGYNATKTNEIAEEAGISEASIFKYFKTKKGLLSAIVNRTVLLLGTELAYKPISGILMNNHEKNLDEVFDLIIEDRLSILLKNQSMLKVLLWEMQYHEDLRDIAVEKIVNPIRKDFKSFMNMQRDKGLIKEDIEDDVILRSIFTGLFSGVIFRLIMNEKFVEKDLKKEMMMVKEIILRGITRQGV